MKLLELYRTAGYGLKSENGSSDPVKDEEKSRGNGFTKQLRFEVKMRTGGPVGAPHPSYWPQIPDNYNTTPFGRD